MTDTEPAKITVRGAVEQTVSFTRLDLETLPTIAQRETTGAGAVSREVRLSELFDAAGPVPEATHVTAISADGSYRASIPISAADASGRVAFAVASGALPAERGGPFRLTIVEGRTLCWNVKDLAELKVTVGPEPDDVPERPPH